MAPLPHPPARARALLALIALAATGCAATSTAWTNEYVDRNGVLREVETFGFRPDELPARHGPATYYHANGVVLCAGAFRDGERSGSWSWYRADGSLEQTGEYLRGWQAGEWLEFGRDGRERFRGSIESGRPAGEWIFRNGDGSVRARGRFEDGQPVGPWLSVNGFDEVVIPDSLKFEHGDSIRVSVGGSRWRDDGTPLGAGFCALPLPDHRLREPSLANPPDATCAWHPRAGAAPRAGDVARIRVEMFLQAGWIATADYEDGIAVRRLVRDEIDALRRP